MVIGALLIQEGPLIAFFSEKLDEANHNYSVSDKEFYAVINALKKWRYYLLPREFVLHIDPQPLRYLTLKPS